VVVGSLLALAVFGSAATGTYTVRSGDSLWVIARKVGSSVGALSSANALTNPDRLQPGQILSIPGAADAAAAPAAAGYHVIAPGDSLSAIAARYGIPVATLKAANGLTGSDRILAGARLRLGGAPAPTPVSVSTGGAHVVRAGDTLGALAARFGTTTAALAAANGIADPNRLRIGDRIEVPSSWRCPVPGARFMNDYGVAKPDGRFHEGVDLHAPRGTPVHAPVAGTVRQIAGSMGGLQFWLTGDDGNLYIGSHLDRAGASGRVAAGAQLGTVGDTGNARGGPPHLHFELHPGGEGTPSANPHPLLVGHCGM
jgi:LysM repeat protein